MSVIKANGAGDQSTGFYNDAATQSLRFAYTTAETWLAKTPNAGNRKTHTLSVWIKRSGLSAGQNILEARGSGDAGNVDIWFDANDKLEVSGGSTYWRTTKRRFRDVSSWYHIMIVTDTVQTGQTFSGQNALRIYVNGVEETLFSDNNHYSENTDYAIGGNVEHRIGDGYGHFDGYMARYEFVDGIALTPASFGETKNGVWIAKKYTGSYGTNGHKLEFKETGTNADSSGLGADTSGNGNHYTPTVITTHDSNMPDSPENNFCTLNPLDPFTGTLREGNLSYANTNSFRASRGNFEIPSSGKWYFEVLNTTATDGDNAIWAGVAHQDTNISAQPNNGSTTKFYGLYNDSSLGILSNGSQSSNTTNQIAANGIIQIAIDTDNNKLYVGINNSYYSNATTTNGDPSAGSNPTESIDLSGYRPFVGAYQNTGVINFGQDPSFGGAITAGTATPGSGAGVFKYAPPSGFLALCTANLPEPTIGPNSDTQSDDHFNTVIYAGNGSNNAVTGVGFQPDWLWTKDLTGTENHIWLDSCRGFTHRLSSNLHNAETTDSNATISSFDADGFTLTQYHDSNVSSSTNVGWCWKGGGAPTATNSAGAGATPTAGSVKIDGSNLGSALGGSIPATKISANTTSGFSIVTFVGNNTNDATIAHALGPSTPGMIITKNRDDTTSGGVNAHWRVWHRDLTDTYVEFISRNLYQVQPSGHSNGYIKTVGSATYSTYQSNVDSNSVNGDGDDMIAYCFADVEGFSKFGSYSANLNNNGPFVFLGFKPAFIMVKNIDTDARNWTILDDKRFGVGSSERPNPVLSQLVANSTAAEFDSASYPLIDILSNGFKVRTGTDDAGVARNLNRDSGDTVIYMAFASAPFKYSNSF